MEQIFNDFETARTRAREMLEGGVDEATIARLQRYGAVDAESGWRKVSARIRPQKRRQTTIMWTAAASLALLVGTAVWLSRTEKEATVPAGTRSATLVLPSGKKIDLGKTKGALDAAAFNDNDIISYGGHTAAEPVWHTLEVPRGGEYKLKLSDGTLVHLNSMSSVRFPVEFTGKRREVELTGEAWFEVVTGSPFIVHTSTYDIEVLGTQFNVSDYAGDRLVSTTLAKGVVKIGDITLNPNEQYTFDTQTGQATIRTVDIALSSAWRTGRLVFRDQRLEDIMRTLGRWYDIRVEYADAAVREMRFGMNLTRQNSIDPLLELLEENGTVSIERHGNRIIINPN